jgi:hypothetical protein
MAAETTTTRRLNSTLATMIISMAQRRAFVGVRIRYSIIDRGNAVYRLEVSGTPAGQAAVSRAVKAAAAEFGFVHPDGWELVEGHEHGDGAEATRAVDAAFLAAAS